MTDLNTDVTDDVTDVDTTDDEWVPPTRDEWEDILDKKRRADSEAASRKRWLRDLGYDPKTGQKLSSGSETDSDSVDRGGAAKPVQVDTAALETAVTTKTEAVFVALAEAGVGPRSLARVSRMIDKKSITIDEDGIEGLAEQVDALKAELPELFKRSRTAPVADVSAVGGGKKKAPVSTPQSMDWEEQIRARFNKGQL
jgi:hypothetical protein